MKYGLAILVLVFCCADAASATPIITVDEFGFGFRATCCSRTRISAGPSWT